MIFFSLACSPPLFTPEEQKIIHHQSDLTQAQKGDAAQSTAETKIDDPNWQGNMIIRWANSSVASEVRQL
ncbi:MAG: hypothetical protein CL916_05100, partial [Deltaproteobacteria bacterium]|nr:hypothetical protein [Deltaproteobacteria bacterium]